MNHTDWLRLQTEGEKICSSLRQQNYRCLKQTRRLSWKIITPLSPSLPPQPPHSSSGLARGEDKEKPLLLGEAEGNYLLTWLPSPVSDWSLIPNDTTQTREKLWKHLQSILNTIRGTQAHTDPHIEQPEDYSRPWAIVRLLPDARRYTVARFYNRADAQDHLRFLKRFIPAAEFEVIFDIPTDLQNTASID
jgi:hypothetical protein